MIWRLAILFSIFASTTSAEVVPLQLGEQGDYTRVVLTLPSADGWSVTEEERAFEIAVPDATRYDFAAFADLVGSRIQAFEIKENGSVLRVTLNCACTVSSYVIGAQFLTIDIAGDVSLQEEIPPLNALSGLGQPWHAPLTQTLTEPEIVEGADVAISTNTDTTLNALDNAVSTGLASATYQGFLNIPTELEDFASAPEISTELLDNISVGVQSQLTTLNATDTAIPDVQTFGCKDVSARLAADWQTDHSFSIERGMAHSMFVSHEDQTNLDESAAISLAILFIGQGLGYEALATLNGFEETSDLTRALAYMARVIDSPSPPDLIGLENCPEDLAFWAYLHAAGTDDVVDSLDPRRLMLTFKLLPDILQTRTLVPFGDALARAGHESFQAELQSFKNTYFTLAYAVSGAPAPHVDFDAPASAREILRAELTDRDLDRSQATRNDPTKLTLELLDTLRMERRGTPAEAALLDTVLERHVGDGDFITVMNLLIEARPRIGPEDYNRMLDLHIGESIARMTEPELLAFAFRSELPDLPEALRDQVATRLTALDVMLPGQFAHVPDVIPETEKPTAEATDPTATEPAFTVPVIVEAPDASMPSYAETEELLAGSEAMRNAIETLINDTN